MPDKIEIDKILDKVVNNLNKFDFDDHALVAERSNTSQIRFADNEITIVKNWASLQLGVFAVKDSKTVVVELEDLSDETGQRAFPRWPRSPGSD